MPSEAKTGDAVHFLELLLDYFADDKHWTQGLYYRGHGRRCLVGAVRYLGRKHQIRIDEAVTFLHDALPRPHVALEHFNDRCRSLAELRVLIVEARAQALADADQRRIRERKTTALALADAEQQTRRQTAAALERRLILARLERERAARAAAGDTRDTYILCPDAPVPDRIAA